MPENIKQELNNITDRLILSNHDMKASYNNYMKKVDEIADYFSDDEARKIREMEQDKVYNMLGNGLINLMKEYKEVSAEMILFSLYGVMSRLEEQENARANSQEYINSLSTNAKKEWARRMGYSSEEMEM